MIDNSGSNLSALLLINAILILHELFYLVIDILQVKYLNNIVEQSHRPLKQKMRQALGFKSVKGAEATLAGVELWQMLRRDQMSGLAGDTAVGRFYSLAA